eukprot:5875059-Amphidinium_carterae.1
MIKVSFKKDIKQLEVAALQVSSQIKLQTSLAAWRSGLHEASGSRTALPRLWSGLTFSSSIGGHFSDSPFHTDNDLT